MDRAFFETKLYPLQDKALALLRDLDTGFYLSGGTAAARVYLHHRYSDDLDFFVNDDTNFLLWVDRAIHSLRGQFDVDVVVRDDRFARITLMERGVPLKIEFINDVPSHVGEIRVINGYGRVDSPENILANKITAALDRREPKDLADLWAFCTQLLLPLKPALHNAESKAAGVFAPDLARVLCSATHSDWKLVRWIEAPPVDLYLSELRALGEALLLL